MTWKDRFYCKNSDKSNSKNKTKETLNTVNS